MNKKEFCKILKNTNEKLQKEIDDLKKKIELLQKENMIKKEQIRRMEDSDIN